MAIYDSKSRYAAEQSSGKTARDEFFELPHGGSFVLVSLFASTSGRKYHYGLTSGVEGDRNTHTSRMCHTYLR